MLLIIGLTAVGNIKTLNTLVSLTATTANAATSTDTSLQSLTTSAGTLSPTFSSSTLNYSVVLPVGSTTVPSISAVATDPLASTTITQATSVTSTTTANRTARVVVAPEVGVVASSTTYTVLFSVATSTGTSTDTIPPVISPHANILNVEASSSAGAIVNFTVNTTDNVDGTSTAVCAPISGSMFALGTTTVTCNKTDVAGNAATSTSFIIGVVDTKGPVITLNGSSTMSIALGTVFADPGATAVDAVSGTTTVSATGTVSTTTLGTYTITYTSKDAALNLSTTTRSVIVRAPDVTPPVIIAHANMLGIEATSSAGAVVTFTVNTTDNLDGTSTAICAPASGSMFALGTTTVTCNKSDASGNVATSTSFIVGVVDTIAPVITLNGFNPMTISLGTTFVDPGATAVDAVDGAITVSATGTVSTTTTGTYTITYTAKDASQNISTTTRSVIAKVLSPESSLLSLITSAGTLDPVFSPTTLDYTVLLPFGTTVIPVVSASSSDPLATIAITQATSITSTSTASRTALVLVTPATATSTGTSTATTTPPTSTTYAVLFSVATSTPVATTTPTPTPTPVGTGGGPSGSSSSGGSFYPGFEALFGGVPGSVLGAATSIYTPTGTYTCNPFKTFMKRGRQNDVNEVTRLQGFLNSQLGLNIPVTGIFGAETESAVSAFQLANASVILAPWVNAGRLLPNMATGDFYKTTQYGANKILCPGINFPMPVI